MARDPTLGPADCNCYHCAGKPAGERGQKPCEYHDHHCPMCHAKGLCTSEPCRIAFDPDKQEA